MDNIEQFMENKQSEKYEALADKARYPDDIDDAFDSYGIEVTVVNVQISVLGNLVVHISYEGGLLGSELMDLRSELEESALGRRASSVLFNEDMNYVSFEFRL